MSLYDDLDVKPRATENISGWSSGIKLLQSQLQLKKAAVTQPKREQQRKASLPPVIDLKSKRDDDDNIYSLSSSSAAFVAVKPKPEPIPSTFKNEYDWNLNDEYDPLWPNEYEKIVKEIRESREWDRDRDRDYDKDDKRRERDRRKKSRFNDPEDEPVTNTPQVSLPPVASGFAGRWEDEEEIAEPPVHKVARGGGAAIAPPLSLQEVADSVPTSSSKHQQSASYGGGSGGSGGGGGGGGSVAAKIMAKYGFKEGQGLGKQEQGMSMALQVEKTSKRGGRIIHEKEILMPPPPPVPGPSQGIESITEIMKSPSKVVLLRNMVGPGEVDDDLEPEVKDECNTKYGDVGSVVIHELQDQPPEDAVRIFVEFKRIESAIKAVVDLNGRFFGGRQVKATFYDTEKFDNFQLLE